MELPDSELVCPRLRQVCVERTHLQRRCVLPSLNEVPSNVHRGLSVQPNMDVVPGHARKQGSIHQVLVVGGNIREVSNPAQRNVKPQH
jgi:hypothetical protein